MSPKSLNFLPLDDGGGKTFLFVMLKHGQQVVFSRYREVDVS